MAQPGMHPRVVRHTALLVLVGLASASVPEAVGPDPLAELQPLVVTGDRVPDLLGAPVGQIWAYRYEEAAGELIQIPIQVDERVPYDLTRNIPGGPWDPVYELTYDWLGADDGLLDGDDEIVVMARDTGDRAPDTDLWVPWSDDVRVELAVEDPLSGGTGYVYLFTSATIVDEDPSFRYLSYVTTDPVEGAASLETPVYRAGYEGRWRLTELALLSQPDMIDRVKARAYAIVGSETEETFQQTSVMLGERSGKVRALREVQGAASGPGTTHLDVFYRDMWIRTLRLRVHAMPNIWYYHDYVAPAARGRYYSTTFADGLPLDGENDVTTDGTWPTWSQVSLPQGTFVQVVRELSPFPVREGASCTPVAGMTFYWRDDAAFDDLSGEDGSAYGNHGVHLQCTEDTNTSPYSMGMTHYLLLPQDPYVAIGEDYARREETPLTITPEAQTRAELTNARLEEVDRAGEGRLAFVWDDALGEDVYEVYRGELVLPFAFGHDSGVGCDLPANTTSWTSTDDQETAQPSYYYLIVPRRGDERSYGTDSDGSPRPPSAVPCP